MASFTRYDYDAMFSFAALVWLNARHSKSRNRWVLMRHAVAGMDLIETVIGQQIHRPDRAHAQETVEIAKRMVWERDKRGKRKRR